MGDLVRVIPDRGLDLKTYAIPSAIPSDRRHRSASDNTSASNTTASNTEMAAAPISMPTSPCRRWPLRWHLHLRGPRWAGEHPLGHGRGHRSRGARGVPLLYWAATRSGWSGIMGWDATVRSVARPRWHCRRCRRGGRGTARCPRRGHSTVHHSTVRYSTVTAQCPA